MVEQIFARIKSRLNSQSILVNDSWLRECIEYYFSENTQISEDNVQKFVMEQFLLSDLREINNINGCLPPNLSQTNTTILDSKYTLQLLKIYDISVPKFKQLEKLKNVSNINIEATNETTQSWEPTGKRMLYLFLTDGIQEILAIEYKPIRILNDSLYPGLKILILGPVICKQGLILLEESNVSIKGGEVDDLLIPNALENVLANALKLPTNDDPYRDNNREPAVPNEFADDFDINFEEIEQIERSEEMSRQRAENLNSNSQFSGSNTNTSTVNNSVQNNRKLTPPRNQNRIFQNFSEFPEDDEIFENLEPDEGFSSHNSKDTHKTAPAVSNFQSTKPSTSANSVIEFPEDDFNFDDVDFDSGLTWSEPIDLPKDKSAVNSEKSEKQPTSNFNNRQITSKKAEEVVTGNKRSSAQLSPLQSSSKVPCPQSTLKISTSNRKITDFIGSKTKPQAPPKVCDFISEVLAITLTDCPIRKTVRGKVTAIGKLVKKDMLWVLEGTINDQSGKLNVDFSSQFMENVLELSVVEFTQMRKKIKKDPQLEEQLRKKMTAGQQKLQDMDCLLELEMKKGVKPVVLSFSQLTQAQKDAHSKRFKSL